ncbi:helix-turn-helix domain-containing protein [Dyella silvae]|uniref:helix-turn-helix domain-containing protein n=1 Tax=Dyella silvae TaxID=2994424 RepID=UPI0022655E0D|nr:helix-turn-helix domain-containing protein [Dyella silvae]
MNAVNAPYVAPLVHDLRGAMTRLHLGKTKLRELIDAGEILAFKDGGKIMVTEEECQRYVARKLREASARRRLTGTNPMAISD